MAAGAGLVVLAAGCTASASGPSSPSPTLRSTGATNPAGPTGLAGGDGEDSGATSTAATTATPTAVRPSSSGSAATRSTSRSASPSPKPVVREVAGDCPYIANPQVQLIEGDRVGRSTVLTSKPAGCRFYFQYDDSAIVAEITVRSYTSPTLAFNAMVLSAKGHPEVVSDSDIGAGAVAIRAPLQGVDTWQCTFAKGRQTITVHTRQPDPSFNARALARALVPRF